MHNTLPVPYHHICSITLMEICLEVICNRVISSLVKIIVYEFHYLNEYNVPHSIKCYCMSISTHDRINAKLVGILHYQMFTKCVSGYSTLSLPRRKRPSRGGHLLKNLMWSFANTLYTGTCPKQQLVYSLIEIHPLK